MIRLNLNRIISVIFIIHIVALFVSCQPTPNNPTVINKNDGKLENKINATNIPDQQITTPAYCKDSIQSDNENLSVNINAEIVIPDAKAYPVVAIEPYDITQETADIILNALIGDKTLYVKTNKRTTDEIMAEIQACYQYIEDDLSQYEESDPDFYSRKYQDIIEWIKYLNELLPDSTNEIKEHSRQFTGIDNELQSKDEEATRQSLQDSGFSEEEINEMMENYNSQINRQQFICGYVDMDKANMATIEINKYSQNQQQVLFYNTDHGGSISSDYVNIDVDKSNEIKISYDDAFKTAQNLIDKIGIKDMALYVAGLSPDYNESEIQFGYVYKFIFTRSFNNVPATYISKSEYIISNQSMIYRGPWLDERMEICIDETGIVDFKWINPVQVNEIINSNVEVLPFDDIKNIFLKQILITNAYVEGSNIQHLEITINRITLGLAKIARKDTDGYMYVPAWDFFGISNTQYIGEESAYLDERYGRSFMTINAIDGSIIDRSLGY